MQKLFLIGLLLVIAACTSSEDNVEYKTVVYRADTQVTEADTSYLLEPDSALATTDTALHMEPDLPAGDGGSINTGSTDPQKLVDFAKTLKNIPYKYGSIDPNVGFDCSGFITYVFNHFGIKVPRSSVDFDNPSVRTIQLAQAKPGDIILFTGTDSTKKVVGHMGIIISKPAEQLAFIHSTSGKAYGVTETPLNTYYQGRFMRAIRVFAQND